jgi:hypothetical protein
LTYTQKSAEETAALLRFVVPRHPEEISAVDIPQPDIGELFLDRFWDLGRIAHLREGRYEYPALSAVLDVFSPLGFIDAQIDHRLLLDDWSYRASYGPGCVLDVL